MWERLRPHRAADVEIRGEVSASVRAGGGAPAPVKKVDKLVMRIELPGLFDLQVNGFAGIDFNAPDLAADRVDEALERMRATGVTRCLPTLITSSFEQFAASARVLRRMSNHAIAGIHMEGPYVSPEDGARGAHPRAHVTPASLDDFNRRQDAAGGRIVLVTLAPEVPGALPLIEPLVAASLRAASGHTAAAPRQSGRRV